MKLVSDNKVIKLKPQKTPLEVMTKTLELRNSGRVTTKTINETISTLRHEGFSDEQIVEVIRGAYTEKVPFLTWLLCGMVFGIFLN